MSKTITGIVTWLRNWFYTKEEIYDTGWQQFPYREGGSIQVLDDDGVLRTKNWNSGSTHMLDYTDQPVRIRRIGKVVHIEGAMTNNISLYYDGDTLVFPLKGLCAGEHNVTTYNGDCFFTVGTLASEFRPSKSPVRRVQQGSGINKYLLIINTDGTVKIGRYGTSSYADPQDNCWLNMNITYLVG